MRLALLASSTGAACTSFAAVRSAEIQPGRTRTLQLSGSTPPSDEAGWFWAWDCEADCGRSVVAVDYGFTFAREIDSDHPYAVAFGIDGVYPYIDGYVQVRRRPRHPMGVGVRFAPFVQWGSYRVYGRYDHILGAKHRLLLNPSVLLYTVRSPNGANTGTIVGFAQGVGLLIDGPHVDFAPAITAVVARGQRTSYSTRIGPFGTFIAVASMTVSWGR